MSPSSSSGPATRSEAIGTLGRDRPDKAIIEPRGVLPIRMPIASSESVDSSASTPSRTSTDGEVREESVALSRGANASQIVWLGRSNASRTPAPSGSIRSTAAAMCFRRTKASLSRSSTVTQANGRASRSAHCARSPCLAVPGRRGDENHREGACGAKPVDERRSRNVLRPAGRDEEFRFEHVEGERRPLVGVHEDGLCAPARGAQGSMGVGQRRSAVLGLLEPTRLRPPVLCSQPVVSAPPRVEAFCGWTRVGTGWRASVVLDAS